MRFDRLFCFASEHVGSTRSRGQQESSAVAHDREIPEGLEYLRTSLERRHEIGRQLIGLTVKDAREVATRSRCTLRLVRLNGKGLTVTADLGLNRIDVSVVCRVSALRGRSLSDEHSRHTQPVLLLPGHQAVTDQAIPAPHGARRHDEAL